MAKKYNPYNAIKSIVGYKGDYHNEQSFGRDPSASHQAALPYYQELVDNGYESIAQQLNDLDYTGAKKLLSNYKPDNEFDLDNDYANLTGEYGSAQSIINAAHPNDASIDKLMNMGTGTTGMAQEAYNTAQGIATGTTPIQPSAATQNLLDAYGRDYERLNGAIRYDQDGNVVSGLTTSHYNTGKQQLDYYNNFDITKQPYYQGIMDAYKLGGYNAAQGEYANGAANNGGNIDSYAAANANRQQLAFTTAGMQQAMAMAQQNATNWNNLYSQMSSDLYNQGQLSLGTLQVARDMYAQDSQERMNALDVQGALASSQMENATQQVLAMIQERMNDKGITAEMAMQEKDIASQIEQLTMQLASNEKIQEGINATNRYMSDNDLTGTLDTNAKNLAGTKYRADADVNIAGINANADLGVAGINADATKYSALQSANASKYGSYYDYLGNKYTADAGVSKVAAQAAADRENAAYSAQLQRDYDEWVMEQATKNGWIPSGYTANPSSGGGVVTEDLSFMQDPEHIAESVYSALTDPDSNAGRQAMMDLGFNDIHSMDEFRNILMAPTENGGYGLNISDANKVIKLLKDSGQGEEEIYAKLNSFFPGIMTHHFSGSTNTNTTYQAN